jgi:beta-phosphoglucomutase-like phosphatase (HAD superfamily)
VTPLPPTTRALLFDMDGTMVDSMPAHARSWEVFTRRHGLDIPVDEVLRRTTGRNGVECIRELFGPAVDDARALQLIGEKEAIYRDVFGPAFREVPGFRDVAALAAAAGLPIAVASAGDRQNIDFALGHLRLERRPDAVVGGDEGLRGKPEPDLFLEAARRLGQRPADCVVFEDAPFGIEAARRAGMPAVAICTTHGADELAGPHVLAHAPDFRTLLAAGFFAAFAR